MVQPNFRSSVYIATSLDGFISRPDGDIAWLTDRDDPPFEAAEGELSHLDHYKEFRSRVDTLVMGRGTYEKVLTFDPWPYEDLKVAVLSTVLDADADSRITVYRDLDS